MIGKMFKMIMDQENYVLRVLDDLVTVQGEKNTASEREIFTIQNGEQQDTQQVHLVTEIQNRHSKSRNLIVHKITESDLNRATERLHVNKAKEIQVLTKIELSN